MKTKIHPPTKEYEITQDKPWADSLGREEYGKFFCNFLLNIDSPTIVELAMGYGEGKTTFLKRCKAYMEQTTEYKEISVKYLNIWQQDFHDEPVIALLAELYDENALGNILKKFGGVLTSFISPILKYHTDGIVDIKSMVSKIKQRKDFITNLKKELKSDQKIIVFIDELDRCRPDFAIRTLEILKHVFSIKNLVFVLATDDNRLKSAVDSLYGAGVASEDYLRKFIDIQLQLPPIDEETLEKLHVQMLGDIVLQPSLREFNAIKYFIKNHGIFKDCTEIYEFTNQLNPQLSIRGDSKDKNDLIRMTAFRFMVYLRHMKPDLYFKIGNTGAFDIEEMLNQLKFTPVQDNKLIKTMQDFKVFLQFICRDFSEHEKFLQEKFPLLLQHIGKLPLKINSLNKYPINDDGHHIIHKFMQHESQEVERRFCENVKEQALFIYLYKLMGGEKWNENRTNDHFPSHKSPDSLAQQMYQVIEKVKF